MRVLFCQPCFGQLLSPAAAGKRDAHAKEASQRTLHIDASWHIAAKLGTRSCSASSSLSFAFSSETPSPASSSCRKHSATRMLRYASWIAHELPCTSLAARAGSAPQKGGDGRKQAPRSQRRLLQGKRLDRPSRWRAPDLWLEAPTGRSPDPGAGRTRKGADTLALSNRTIFPPPAEVLAHRPAGLGAHCLPTRHFKDSQAITNIRVAT